MQDTVREKEIREDESDRLKEVTNHTYDNIEVQQDSQEDEPP